MKEALAMNHDSQKTNFRRLSFGLFLGILLIPLLSVGCAKSKKDPNVSYEGGEGGSSESGSSGDIGQSDLGDSRSGGRRGATAAGLQTVYFDYDSASLTSDAKTTVQENADYLKKNSNTNVTVEGHCDDRGSTEYNLALGERRANAVRDYMVNLGVAKKRLKTVSYGEERPVMKGENESAWSKNRRAEFSGVN
jgi:peptidoglycan-associated lipoprotein